MSRPANRQQAAILGFLDPGNIGAEPEPDHQLHPQLDPAADAAHQSDDIGGMAARRHEVDQLDDAGSGLKPRLQDQRIGPVAARGVDDLVRRRDQPAAVLVGAEQAGETGIGIESRPAQPVDRTVASDQSGGLAISDQSVIFDSGGQLFYLLLKMPAHQTMARDRSLVASLSAETSIAGTICSIAIGSRCRQFGCSLTVPGILGWSITPNMIFQRYRQQAGLGPRQKSHDGGEIVTVDGIVTQHLAQHRQRMPPRIVGFTGIDPERAFQLEIAERAPARIAGEIVGIEGDERIGHVMVDIAERAIILAFEHHHLIRPDAPIRHLFAKALRHGAEVFADHHAAMRHAFLRGRSQQRLERHLHIGAFIGGKTVRHQIEPLQAQHMVEPDRAGVPHRRPQHRPERLKRLQLQTGGVEAGEAPILAGDVQLVGRRADREIPGNRDLLVPGIEAVGLHADRDIEIKTDLHAEPGRALLAGLQLTVRHPLHEFDEFDLGRIGARAQGRAFGLFGLPPLLRPFPPWLVEFVPQRLEAGEPRQQRRALGAKLLEILPAARFRVGFEAIERCAQRPPFQRGDGDIIDDIALPQPRDAVAAPGEGVGLKFGKLFGVDIQRIEKQPAVRRIGAAIAGPVVEQRVQRIETDAIRPQLAGEFDQPFEVGEIPHPPVALRPDAVELDRQ